MTMYLHLIDGGLRLDTAPKPALLQIALDSDYKFIDTKVVIKVIDTKEPVSGDDPLHHLVFDIRFLDKVDDSEITKLLGRVYVGGGVEALERAYPQNLTHISQKLDFYGVMDGGFFNGVQTSYQKDQKEQIIKALSSVMNTTTSYRTKSVSLSVPNTPNDTDKSTDDVRLAMLKVKADYLAIAGMDDLAMIETLMGVVDKENAHLFIDVGNVAGHEQVVALVNGLNLDDHRVRVLYNPNKSRASNTGLLAVKRWRPCVGDYLAKHLLRNVNTDNNGIPPLHIPIGGYDFPVNFAGMTAFDSLALDDEAFNQLAMARVITVIAQDYQDGTRYIYGDVLTQKRGDNGALRLGNSSEIATFTANAIIRICKRHLLSNMTDYIENATSECARFLDACVVAGLLKPAEQLGGQYYALSITPRTDKPFEAVDVNFARRPEGATRQIYLETTINR